MNNPPPAELPEHVRDDENLARFLIQSSHFSNEVVKPAAFLPNPKHRETSVSRHGPLPLEMLWELGTMAAGTRSLHGAAILRAGDVRKVLLEVAADPPPPRHAVIRGWFWSEDDPDGQKERQKKTAVLLTGVAQTLLRPKVS